MHEENGLLMRAVWVEPGGGAMFDIVLAAIRYKNRKRKRSIPHTCMCLKFQCSIKISHTHEHERNHETRDVYKREQCLSVYKS